ncbi:MAG: hypothetical protein WA777_11540 [Rhodanobacter sp.]
MNQVSSVDLQARSAQPYAIRAKRSLKDEVLRIASAIEPDQRAVMSWYRDDGIAEFSNRTAHQIVNDGEANHLLRFLRAIMVGLRD